MKVDAVYKDGVLKIISPVKIEDDRIVVRIVNRDEILTPGIEYESSRQFSTKSLGKGK